MNRDSDRSLSKKKIGKDYLAVIFGTGLGRGLSFFTSLIIARLLGVEEFGLFSIFFTIMMLVWQFPTVFDGIYVRYAKVEPQHNIILYLRSAFWLKTIIFISLQFLAYPIGYVLSFFIFKKPELFFYIIAAITSGTFLSMFTTLAAVYQAEEKFYLFSIINFFFYASVFTIVIGIVVLGFQLTYRTVILVYCLSTISLGIFGIIKIYNLVKPLMEVQKKILYGFIKFGKWIIAEQVIYILLQRIDILYLARFADFEELGIYSAAVRISMLASLFTSAASFVLMPRGCKALNSPEQLKLYLREAVIVVSILSIIIIIMIILSSFLVNIFFGPKFSTSVLSCRILLMDTIFVLFYLPLSYFFWAAGKSLQIFKLGIAKLVVTVVALHVLVPYYGAIGASASIALSSFCGFLLVATLSIKVIKDYKRNILWVEGKV